MEIDTHQTAIKVKLRKLFTTVIVGASLIFIYLTDVLDPIGFYKNYIAVGIVLIYVSLLYYFYMLDLNYIYYSDEGGKIILRYYSLRTINSGYKSIEIPKKNFVKYHIERSFFNLKEKLILYQRMQKGLAKYPPVSISALKLEERDRLKQSLTHVLENQ